MNLIEDHPDIFTCGAYALVNPVNCVGVAGKGLALEFKKRFPDSFQYYRDRCRGPRKQDLISRSPLKPGDLVISYDGEHADGSPGYSHMIVAFPTKIHWKDPSQLEFIKLGMEAVNRRVLHIPKHKVRSIAIPALGCGLDGLKWTEVRSVILQSLWDYSGTVYLFPPKEG